MVICLKASSNYTEVGNLSWKQKRILLKNGNFWKCILGNNRFVSKYFQFILLARWLKIMSHHNDWRGSYLKYTALAKNKRSQKVRLNVFDRLETAIRLKLIGQKDTLEIWLSTRSTRPCTFHQKTYTSYQDRILCRIV